MELYGKNIIVTGGASGIGKRLVQALIKEDCRVGVIDKNKTGLDALSREVNIDCQACDVSNVAEVAKVIDYFDSKFGNLHALVNSVGLIYSSPLISFTTGAIKKHDVEMWQQVIKTNLDSVFYMTSHVVEKMVLKRSKGVVINLSSICATGNAGQSAYSAAKAAINALTVTWAKELSLLGIRVAAVAPGFVETESTKKALSDAVLKEWIKKTPLRRLATVEEVVDSIIYILKNDFFNGKILEIDGGLTVST